MPQSVQVEGVGTVEFPDDASPDEIGQALNQAHPPPGKPGALKTFGEHAAVGVGPGAAFIAGAEPGAAIGSEIGTPFGPIGMAIGGAIGGLVTGVPAAWLVNKGQHGIAKAVAPEFTQQLDTDLAAGQEAHPLAAIAGDVASLGPSAKMAPFKLATLPFRAGLGAGLGAVLPMVTQQRLPTTSELAEGAIMGTVFGEPRFKLLPRSKAAVAALTKGKPNAVPERSTEALPVGKAPGDSGEVGKGVSTPEAPAQAQGQEVAKEGQVPLKGNQLDLIAPEHREAFVSERDAIETPVEVVDRPLDPNEPFARQMMTIRRAVPAKNGQPAIPAAILVNPKMVNAWLKSRRMGGVPEGQARAALRSAFAEEQNHLATTDEQALDYHNNATAFERYAHQGAYGGAPLSPTLLGHEMVAADLAKIARIPRRTTIEAGTWERYKVKTLFKLADIVKGIRETIGTKASKEQLAILGHIQGNLDAGIAVLSGASPGASRKETQPDLLVKEGYGEEHDQDPNRDPESEAFQLKMPTVGEVEYADENRHDVTQPTLSFKDEADVYSQREKILDAALDNGWSQARAEELANRIFPGSETPGATSKIEDEESKLGPEIERISGLPVAEQVAHFKRDMSRANQTPYQLGFQARNMADVEALEKASDDAIAKMRAALKTGNFNEASQWGKLGQDFREAHEAATGTASAGKYLRENRPDYNPPVPLSEEQSLVNKRERAKQEQTPGARRKESDEELMDKLVSLKTAMGQTKVGSKEATDHAKQIQTLEAELSRRLKSGEQSFPAARRKGDKEPGFFLPPIAAGQERPAVEAKGVPTAVNLEQFDFTKPEAVKFVDPEMLDKPYTLGRFLTTGAAVSGDVTRTLGRAVVALEKDGKVDLVHAYQDPNDLARVQDPTKTGERTHVSIRQLLDQGYKPIAGLMLKEPVKSFNQHFDSVDEFQKSFGEPAKQAWYKGQQYREGGAIKGTESVTGKAFKGESAEEGAEETVTPTDQRKMERGYAMLDPEEGREGREAKIDESQGRGQASLSAEDDKPGVLAGRMQPISEMEASSLVDHFDLSKATTPKDIAAGIKSLSKENRSVISALRKIGAQLDNGKFLTDDQLVEAIAQRIYDTHNQAQNYDEFVQRTIQQGPGQRFLRQDRLAAAKLAEARAAQPVETGGTELTTPGRTKPIRRGSAVYRIRPPEASPMLAPKDLAALEARQRATAPAAAGQAEASRMLAPSKPTGEMSEFKGEPPRGGAGPEPMEGPRNASVFKYERWLERQEQIRRERLSGKRRAVRPTQGEFPIKPAARAKFVQDQIKMVDDEIKDAVTKAFVSDNIARTADAAGNLANNTARAEETGIRIQSAKIPKYVPKGLAPAFAHGNRDILSAANVLVEAGFDRSKIPEFRDLVDKGRVEALKWSRSESFRQRMKGRAWLRSNNELMKELDYAEKNWGKSDLQATAKKMATSMSWIWDEEKARGFQLEKAENYGGGHRYDASVWNEHSMLFNAIPGMEKIKILGKKYTTARTFATTYHAAAEGPYIPVTRDGASIVGHRVRQGMNRIEREAWQSGLMDMKTTSGKPVAMEVKRKPSGELFEPEDRDYTNMRINGKDIAVHDDYRSIIRNLTSPSQVQDWAFTRGALQMEQKLKHMMLIGDFFHLGRVLYYGASIMGKNAGYKAGLAVLDIKPTDLHEAVRRGIVSENDAKWATEKIKFGDEQITRRALAEKFVRAGANLGKIQDALYKDLVTDMTPAASPIRRGVQRVIDPTVGRYNRFLFDNLTRGLMAESNLREFERQHAADPSRDPNALVKDISRDVNNYFGNIGKQGWMKSATQKDISRLLLLAPDWLEGLVKKEASFYGRASGVSKLAGRREGVSNLGTTGLGIGRGLLTLFAATQAINLISRRQPTWMNEEKGHKFDAYIGNRDGEGGFWFSPLAVFNELSHDLWRYVESDKTSLEAVDQVLGNKESPLTRAAIMATLGATGKLPKPTTSMGQLGMAAKAIVPTPLTFGALGRAAGHAIAPGHISPNAPGALGRQLFATAGIKVEPKLSAAQEVGRKAQDFAKANGFAKETGWQQVQTDEPSYSKLRAALRSGDEAEAKRQFEAIRKTHTDKQIFHAMRLAKNRPFTGSKKGEHAFIRSLDDRELNAYYKALDQREAEYQSFLDFVLKQP